WVRAPGPRATVRAVARTTHDVVIDVTAEASSEWTHVSARGRAPRRVDEGHGLRSEEHTSELQSQSNLVCRLLLEKKKKKQSTPKKKIKQNKNQRHKYKIFTKHHKIIQIQYLAHICTRPAIFDDRMDQNSALTHDH